MVKQLNIRGSNHSNSIPLDLEYSQLSVISSMSKFLDSIREMNNTVLVPSKLMDLKADDDSVDDLHSIFSLINQLKDELTLGRLDDDYSPATVTTNSSTSVGNSRLSGHSMLTSASLAKSMETRKAKSFESDDGFSSLNSFSQSSCTESSDEASDSDSECGKFCDLKELDTVEADYSSPQCLINLFRLHLQGIQSTLNRFTEYANQISDCYQKQLE